MARKKNVEQMSSDELFELAKARQDEELAKAREAVREKVDALREKRKALLAKHRKELAAIDSQIRKLGGKTASGGRGRGSVNVSKAVIDILTEHEKLSTKEIQAQLATAGVVANNLSQTLAYLKRQGKISSPSRSVYSIA